MIIKLNIFLFFAGSERLMWKLKLLHYRWNWQKLGVSIWNSLDACCYSSWKIWSASSFTDRWRKSKL